MPRAAIQISALDGNGETVDRDDPAAVQWLVSDRGGRARSYDDRDDAEDAAATFRALGVVLIDEPEPVRVDPAAEAAAKAEMDEFVADVLDELLAVSMTDMERLFPHDAAEIEAIGDVGEGRSLASGEHGLELRGPGDEMLVTIPRGTDPGIARDLIEAWDAGYRRGDRDGAQRARAQMHEFLESVA